MVELARMRCTDCASLGAVSPSSKTSSYLSLALSVAMANQLSVRQRSEKRKGKGTEAQGEKDRQILRDIEGWMGPPMMAAAGSCRWWGCLAKVVSSFRVNLAWFNSVSQASRVAPIAG